MLRRCFILQNIHLCFTEARSARFATTAEIWS